jgi:hypothetical protein
VAGGERQRCNCRFRSAVPLPVIPAMSSTVHDLKTLIQSYHSVIAIESVE